MAAASDADTRRISESLFDQVTHGRSDIIDFSASGVLDVQIAKPFSVTRAATKIRLEYQKPFLSKKRDQGERLNVTWPSGPPCAQITVEADAA